MTRRHGPQPRFLPALVPVRERREPSTEQRIIALAVQLAGLNERLACELAQVKHRLRLLEERRR